MNKHHWNTLELDDRLSAALVKDLVRHSFDLVSSGLPKTKAKAKLPLTKKPPVR